ncbi:MAG: DUF397 domain-containing protein [Mycobacteriales bacterium]
MNNSVAIQWRKSSSCIGGSQCIEVANVAEGLIGVRDSKDRQGPVLTFSAQQWQGFVVALQRDTGS